MFSSRFFSVISMFLVFFIFSRTTLYATSNFTRVKSNVQIQEFQESLKKEDQQLAYEVLPVLEDTSNISSFNQKKYSCSDDGESCEEDEQEAPCKACAVASGVNCGISVCTFGVAVIAMIIAALVIANAGDDNVYVH